MSVCPQGHQSATSDFCDVCGAPIDPNAQPAAAPPAPPPPSIQPPQPPSQGPSLSVSVPAQHSPWLASTPVVVPGASPAAATTGPVGGGPKACPNCSTQNPADALFCEVCGYDFATGQLPPPPTVIDPISGVISAPVAAPPVTAPPSLAGIDWVAEIWVDPDWFAHQQAEGACPTGGLPSVVPLVGTSALIGRRSRSRNIQPEIDCSADAAISHSHAELNFVNGRWAVKDLGSTNGTYVGDPGGTFPSDPLPARQSHELEDDERIYLGAWTRVVVRRATDAERAGAASA